MNRVFVANLPREVTRDDLNIEFSKCGTIRKSNLVFNPETGVSKGYGFVEFTTPAEAGVAVQALNGYSFKGRKITVELAQN